MQGQNTVVLPHKASRKQDVSCPIKLNVIKRFEFTSQTMKSGAVVVPEDAPEGTALLLVKGAPNVIKHMARAGNIPDNYDGVIARLFLHLKMCAAPCLKCIAICAAVLCCCATQECGLAAVGGKPVSIKYPQCLPCQYISSCMKQAPHMQQTILI